MTPEEKAAYIQSQCACAMIEAMGYQAENQVRAEQGCSIAYDEEAFAALENKYVIGHNTVVSFLQGV